MAGGTFGEVSPAFICWFADPSSLRSSGSATHDS